MFINNMTYYRWEVKKIYEAEAPVFRHKSLLSCYVDKHAAV